MESRQTMIEAIENTIGIWEAVWNEWPTSQLQQLYLYVKTQEQHRKIRIEK